ncbi:hypothetical protein HFP72_02675 [Nocardiopsis sp. ARC36]
MAAVGLGVTAFTGAYAFAGPLLSGPLVAGSTRRALVVALALFNLGNLVTALAPASRCSWRHVWWPGSAPAS